MKTNTMNKMIKIFGILLTALVTQAGTLVLGDATGVFGGGGGGGGGFATSLGGHWKFNEASGNAADSSGNGTTLANNNTATFTAGKLSNAATFNAASSQSFSVADNNFISTSPDLSFSFTVWAKFTDLSVIRPVVHKGWDGSDGEFILYYNAGNNDWRVQVANGSAQVVEGSTTPATGTWFFFAFTYNAATDQLSLSVNAGTAATATYAGGNPTSSGALKVGEGVSQFMSGQIDDFAIWPGRVLSGAEITSLYNAGSGLDF
jgi:hypothetical protein